MTEPRLVWSGYFSMKIPDGWELRETPELIDVVPPEPIGAAHLSVLKRSLSRPVGAGEASELVLNFARSQQAMDVAGISEQTVDGHQTAEVSVDVEASGEARH